MILAWASPFQLFKKIPVVKMINQIIIIFNSIWHENLRVDPLCYNIIVKNYR